MNHEDEAYTRTTTISQQAVDAIVEVLQAQPGNHIDHLSLLAIIIHHLMESQEMNTFESLTFDGRGIRFTCTSEPQKKPTLH